MTYARGTGRCTGWKKLRLPEEGVSGRKGRGGGAWPVVCVAALRHLLVLGFRLCGQLNLKYSGVVVLHVTSSPPSLAAMSWRSQRVPIILLHGDE